MKAGAFEEDIESDTSGFFKRLLVSASTVRRNISTEDSLCFLETWDIVGVGACKFNSTKGEPLCRSSVVEATREYV